MKLNYDIRQRKKASTLLALASTEIEAANALIEMKLFREAVVHLYFASFYVSQSLLRQKLGAKPSHPAVESQLHKVYGRSPDFPRRYVELHSRLHKLRTEIHYRSARSPQPSTLRRDARYLFKFYTFARRCISEISYEDILSDILQNNPKKILDFSVDVYCPKTYSHHTRLTVWFPPFYLPMFTMARLTRHVRQLLRQLRVRKAGNYVAGLNSKLDQYSDRHLVMLEMDSVDAEVEGSLEKIGGTLLKSGRGFHFVGRHIIEGQKEWAKAMRRFLRDPILGKRMDRKHIDISLRRGYSTLRITSSPAKPSRPQFYKEF